MLIYLALFPLLFTLPVRFILSFVLFGAGGLPVYLRLPWVFYQMLVIHFFRVTLSWKGFQIKIHTALAIYNNHGIFLLLELPDHYFTEVLPTFSLPGAFPVTGLPSLGAWVSIPGCCVIFSALPSLFLTSLWFLFFLWAFLWFLELFFLFFSITKLLPGVWTLGPGLHSAIFSSSV